MRLYSIFAAVLAAAFVEASALDPANAEINVLKAAAFVRRALPNSPDGYTPSRVRCPPTRPSVRSASSLSQNETAWLEKRRNNTIAPMRDFLTRMNISNFDVGSYIDTVSQSPSQLPNVGIAFSGGGWRALLSGAGFLQAFDSRTESSTGTGQLGGLLQSSTYVAGLSGGSWLVGSIYINNFTTVTALRDDTSGTVWEFGNSVIEGPKRSGLQIFNTAEYYTNLFDDVNGKRDAGFEISITDLWGRALSYQLINATEGGPAYTWSSIALMENFQNGEIPFPIALADARRPGEKIVSLNSSNYEFNPFEMGTWDPTAFGFVPTQYLGTNFTAGSVSSDDNCILGWDNAGYIMGTSSSLFNQFALQLNSSDIPEVLRTIVSDLLGDLGRANDDIADYSPNPFAGWNPSTNPYANVNRLTLVDGGEDNQNIPLNPLIQPVRGVDVIFAVDNSADTSNNWPNGSSLVATYERTFGPISNGTGFPSIPDVNTFINLGLNTRPTFFGCNASNITNGNTGVPLVVYLPNFPYVTFSNEPTFSFTTNDSYRDALILNGYNIATMANGTRDSTWPTCAGCAILSRSLDRTGTTIPTVCQECFDRFCWNGTVDSTTPAFYNPSPILDEVNIQNSASMFKAGSWTSQFAALAAGVTLLAISV